MLCVNSYPKQYIDGCRSKMELQLATYKTLVAEANSSPTVAAFEPIFFSNLVLVLDSYFLHRSRGIEKKDGNPLNEVRMLCASFLQNNGVLAADKSIKYNPEKSVLKLQIGDAIQLTESDFTRLFEAFFADIEAKFVE